MKRIEVKVYVPAALALKAGACSFGESLVTPNEDDVRQLTASEATVLASILEKDEVLMLKSPTTTWGAVRESLSFLAGMRD